MQEDENKGPTGKLSISTVRGGVPKTFVFDTQLGKAAYAQLETELPLLPSVLEVHFSETGK